jgi:predicted molibdopterin-dependent oxidoreductase YjgC
MCVLFVPTTEYFGLANILNGHNNLMGKSDFGKLES